jgi:hypothetical protein
VLFVASYLLGTGETNGFQLNSCHGSNWFDAHLEKRLWDATKEHGLRDLANGRRHFHHFTA